MKYFKENYQGFSLLELLVVIGIIGLLATFSVAMVGVAREKSKISTAGHDIDQIYKAIVMMANDTGEWPKHQTADEVCSGACGANEICGPDTNAPVNNCASGLDDESSGILSNDSGTAYNNWAGPYMPSLPLDPWGHEYFFDTDYEVKTADNTPCDGDASCKNVVVVGSYGPDGKGVPRSSVPDAYGDDDIIKILK